ncbi:MAG TPA: GNAT family N-acetyltransferase [Mycobacterium sp.]|nr:GNAT family N-acetyltransferase [Mycobacterium sp.]
MPVWRLRDYHDDDLEQVISIWEQSRHPDDSPPIFAISEVVSAARSSQPAVVATVGDELAGIAVAQFQGERAWVSILALSEGWHNRGIGSALLAELELRLRGLGVRRISALLPAAAGGLTAFQNSGYQQRAGLIYLEKVNMVGASDVALLSELGAQIMPRGRWEAMAGMESEKQIVERRIVLPLTQPAVAQKYGVSPPKAVILFGPPGTGKTSFAKAVAGRLGWPFIELFPSRLAAPGETLASALRETFAALTELEAAVVFIDEVEEVAGSRSGVPSDPAYRVTNELLKLIPPFRQCDDRLLICATNSVSSLDPAFLRPGRFDYVIPVGPPDAVARKAIWERYLGAAAGSVDAGALVAASEMFTPADIEFAARKGAQFGFEREVEFGLGESAQTTDYLRAINETRPSLTQAALDGFAADTELHARL